MVIKERGNESIIIDKTKKYSGCFLEKESVEKIKKEFPLFNIKENLVLVLEHFEKLVNDYGESDAHLLEIFRDECIGKKVTLLIDKVAFTGKDKREVWLHVHDLSFCQNVGLYEFTELETLLMEEPVINATGRTLPKTDENIEWEDRLILTEATIGIYVP